MKIHQLIYPPHYRIAVYNKQNILYINMAAPAPIDPLATLLESVNTVSVPATRTMATPETPNTRPIAEPETPEVATSAAATTQAPSPSPAAPSTSFAFSSAANTNKQRPPLQHPLHQPLPPPLLLRPPRLRLNRR